MNTVDPSAISELLTSQPWFGGKGWPIREISLLDRVPLGTGRNGDALRYGLAVVQVKYEVAHLERFLLPVSVHPDGTVGDPSEDPAFPALLWAAMHRPTPTLSTGGQLVPVSLSNAPVALGEDATVRRVMAEQTNTSWVLGDEVIVKLVRRLEGGVGPELEMEQFLAERTSFRALPRPLAAAQLTGAAEGTVAIAHRFIPGAVDGWHHVLSALRAPGPSAKLLDDLSDLGLLIAELHLALASDASDPNFAPEPILKEDLQRWSASMIGELGVAVAEAGDAWPQLETIRPRVLKAFRELAHLPARGMKIRVHGDLHLGQLLHTASGWWVFDFEGEPLRSLPQKKEKLSPLKDVAGILRSLRYADAAKGLSGNGTAKAGREAFRRAYLARMEGSGLLPEDPAEVQSMLNVLELEKALYEVRYEVRHRPDWVHIPVETLMHA